MREGKKPGEKGVGGGGGQGFQRVLRDAAAEGDTDATLGNQRAPVTEVGVTPFHAPRDFGFSRAFLEVLSFRQ